MHIQREELDAIQARYAALPMAKLNALVALSPELGTIIGSDLPLLLLVLKADLIGVDKVPAVGEKIWVESAFYIDRGEDDVCGGLATVREVVPLQSGTDFEVSVHELPRRSYYWSWLKDHQLSWAREYTGKFAHECPDYG